MLLKSTFFLKLCLLLMTFDVSLQFNKKIHKLMNAIVYKKMSITSEHYLNYLVNVLKTQPKIKGKKDDKLMFYEAAAWSKSKKNKVCKRLSHMQFANFYIQKNESNASSTTPVIINSVEQAASVVNSYSFELTMPNVDINPENIVTGILLMINIILKKPGVPEEYEMVTEPMALRFLMHFIQDAHQPNHVFNLVDKHLKVNKKTKSKRKKSKQVKILKKGDNYGKKFKVIVDLKSTSLHKLWDLGLNQFEQSLPNSEQNNSFLIGREADIIYQNYMEKKNMNKPSLLFEKVDQTIAMRTNFSEALNTTTDYIQFMGLLKEEIIEWVQESKRVAKMYVYNGAVYGKAITPEYIDKGKAIMMEQIVVAAQRTQQVIEKLLNLIPHIQADSDQAVQITNLQGQKEAARIKVIHEQREAARVKKLKDQEAADKIRKAQEQEEAVILKRIHDREEEAKLKILKDKQDAELLEKIRKGEQAANEAEVLKRIRDREEAEKIQKLKELEDAAMLDKLKRLEEEDLLNKIKVQKEEARLKLLQDQEEAALLKKIKDGQQAAKEAEVLKRIQDKENADKLQKSRDQEALERAKIIREGQEAAQRAELLKLIQEKNEADKLNASLQPPVNNSPLNTLTRKLIGSVAQAPSPKRVRENLLQI